MKISGSSKIVDPNEKLKQEELVATAEAIDLLHNEEELSPTKKKIAKAKQLAVGVIEKARPLREKQKELTSTAITKARQFSPYVDKTITAMDIAIKYITTPGKIEGRSDVVQETRPPAIFGVWVLIITFGIGMMWAILAPLDSASHAMGTVILESKKRIIQHPDGGVIKEVLVKDGDHVIKGQPLITLDDTELKAYQQQYQYKVYTLLAELNRLVAEKDNLPEITFNKELLDNQDDSEIKHIINNQLSLFKARSETNKSQISLLEKRVSQTEEQRNSLLPQIEATEKQVKIYKDQVERFKRLHAKGNVSKNALQEVESRSAEYESRKGQLESNLAASEHAVLQAKFELEANKNKIYQEITDTLKQVKNQLLLEKEALKQVNEKLARTIITAPESGDISNVSNQLTPRGVLPHHHPLMEVIPQDDKMVVEVKINAQDIASVQIGQETSLSITSYKSRIVPIMKGKLVSLSADVIYPTHGDTVNYPYYKGRIEIYKEELEEFHKLYNVKLYPGMHADVLIVTGTRTLMKYLLDPVTQVMRRSLKEK